MLKVDVEQVLRHPARRLILLVLHSNGPMSPAEFSKSRLGKGTRLEVYSYHFKELHRRGFLDLADKDPADKQSVTRYMVTGRVDQSVINAAALLAIRDVLARIPEPLASWIEGPFVDEIADLVDASGQTIN
jgi:hypothetical protein